MHKSVNPATQEILKEFNLMSKSDVSVLIEKAHQSYISNIHLSPFDRSLLVRNVANVLRDRKEDLSLLITEEMGKLLSESQSEIDKCIACCDYYADNAPAYLADTEIETEASQSYTTYNPLGVILGVMPWNYPLWQVIRFAIPTLAAGNAVLLKHASNVPQCALAIQDLFAVAGFEPGMFTTLIIDNSSVEEVITHDLVKGVSLTGSGGAGSAVAAIAGKHLKKSVLELGGSDPYIVLNDADVPQAATICAKARLMNAGQSCIGAKRFIVHQDVYEDFLSDFRSKMEKYSFVSPRSGITGLAPMASLQHREDLHMKVLEAIANGAHLLTGGYIPTDIEGAYYPPTILTEMSSENPVYREELFGPVAMVFRVANTEQAIELANDTPFGLGAALFTRDAKAGNEIARTKLNAGSCFVNAQVKSDPKLPFGGIGISGYGRELSHHGLSEFVNLKTVYVA